MRLHFWLAASALALAGPALAAPVTLDEAIAAAETHAPSLAIARADADAAEKRADAARAAGGPTATLTGTIGWGRLDPGGYFGLTATNVTPRAALVGIEQPPYTGGRIAGAREAAKAGEEAAAASVMQRRTALRAEVAQAFDGILASEAALTAATDLVKAIGLAADQARLRFDAGEVPSTDVQQAQARLAAARQRLAGRTRLVQTRHRQMEVAEAGNGPPVLMVHGTGGGFDQALAFAAPLVAHG